MKRMIMDKFKKEMLEKHGSLMKYLTKGYEELLEEGENFFEEIRLEIIKNANKTDKNGQFRVAFVKGVAIEARLLQTIDYLTDGLCFVDKEINEKILKLVTLVKHINEYKEKIEKVNYEKS